MTPIIPPSEDYGEPVQLTIRLPQKRWDDLDAVAEQETKARGKTYSRNQVCDHFLKWALEQYRDESGTGRGLEAPSVRIQRALAQLEAARGELVQALREAEETRPASPKPKDRR